MNRERYRTNSSMLMALLFIETLLQLLPPIFVPERSLAQTASGNRSKSATTPAPQAVSLEPTPSAGSPQLSEPQKLSRPLNVYERRYAEAAWNYFKANYQYTTGLVSDRQNVNQVTMLGIGDYVAALNAARSLEIISPEEFNQRTRLLLGTLKNLPLDGNKLPSRSYDIHTLQPTDYSGNAVTGGTGWSASDMGRLLATLHNLKSCHPEYTNAVDEILLDWSYLRVVRNRRLLSAIAKNDQKTSETGTDFTINLLYPENRLGYEEYAARGFQLWGFNVERSDVGDRYETALVEGVKVPTRRTGPDVNPDLTKSTVSHPFLLYGLEFGFDPKMRQLFEAIRLAQAERYRRTGKLTAGGTTVLDREPHLIHSTVIAGKQPWATVDDSGKPLPDVRMVSTAIAFATHALYPEDAYAQKLLLAVTDLYDPSQGYYEGFYEKTGNPVKTFSSSTNSMILQSLLYQATQQPLIRTHSNLSSPWWRAATKPDASRGLITPTPQARLINDASGNYWTSSSKTTTVAQSSPATIKKPPVAKSPQTTEEFTAPVTSPPPSVQEFTAPVASPPPQRIPTLPRPLLIKDSNRIAAEIAWRYFERNWNPETGLVNSADSYPVATVWDQGSAILAIHAARQLGLIGSEGFNRRIDRLLQTLDTLPPPAAGLPNTAYSTRTAAIELYNTRVPPGITGSSAVDAARFLLALHILRTYYPETTASRINRLVVRWNLPQLIKNRLLKDGLSERQGYEQYAANVLKLWNIDVTGLNIASVNVAQSNLKNLGSINDQTLDPYILWGLELGWSDAVKAQLTDVLKAQAQMSYFKYYSLSTNAPPWQAMPKKVVADRPVGFLGTKSAFAWESLVPEDPYAKTLRNYVQSLAQEDRGYMSGRYENPQKGVKAAIDVNTNGLILESLLYQATGGHPLAF